MRRMIAVLAALALGVLAGCGDETTPEPTATSPDATQVQSPETTPEATPEATPTPEPVPSPSPTPSPTGLPGAGPGPYQGGQVPGTQGSFIADVRSAAHDGFDRVVFEFTGTVPTYRVESVPGDPSFENMEGEPIPVSGQAALTVWLQGTSRYDFTQDYRPVFDVPYPARIRSDTVAVTEVVEMLDFEAESWWIIGLTGTRPFLVSTLDDPGRLVIDIQQTP